MLILKSLMAIDKKKVYSLLRQIPEGKISTYKDLALAVGTKSFRSIGQILKCNPDAPKTPCHRIVKSNGEMGGYAFGLDRKISLLEKEGIKIADGKIINFKQKLFNFKL